MILFLDNVIYYDIRNKHSNWEEKLSSVDPEFNKIAHFLKTITGSRTPDKYFVGFKTLKLLQMHQDGLSYPQITNVIGDKGVMSFLNKCGFRAKKDITDDKRIILITGERGNAVYKINQEYSELLTLTQTI